MCAPGSITAWSRKELHPHREEAGALAAARFQPGNRTGGQRNGRRKHRVSKTLVARVLQLLQSLLRLYSGTSALLGTHAVDEFLWETRRGFCEHFAASFAFFMRSVRLPRPWWLVAILAARSIPPKTSVTVRQYDAHAWAEVWIEGRGWQQHRPDGCRCAGTG